MGIAVVVVKVVVLVCCGGLSPALSLSLAMQGGKGWQWLRLGVGGETSLRAESRDTWAGYRISFKRSTWELLKCLRLPRVRARNT
jgi:hypothetical protein